MSDNMTVRSQEKLKPVFIGRQCFHTKVLMFVVTRKNVCVCCDKYMNFLKLGQMEVKVFIENCRKAYGEACSFSMVF